MSSKIKIKNRIIIIVVTVITTIIVRSQSQRGLINAHELLVL